MESQTKQSKNNPTPDKILVLGIGNLVLNDEGIGIHVVNALSEMEIPQGVDPVALPCWKHCKVTGNLFS